MDAGERELFAASVEAAVARGGDLDAALVELGWAEALAEDEQTAVSVLFEALGRVGAASCALELLVRGGADEEPVLLPAFGSVDPPGRLADGAVEVDGLGLALRDRDVVHVPCAIGDGVAVVAVGTSQLHVRQVRGLDPSLGLVAVMGRFTPPHEFWPGAVDRPGHEPGPELVQWGSAVARGQRAVAHQLAGASAQMLALAREHALDRVQFGVPIASFQAIRHKLADTYVAVESVRTALDAAWEDPSPVNAAAAKAIAGRAARLAAKHCQQVLAGIGFTTEHPLHTYVRRVRALDGLFGDSRTLTQAIGAQLLAARGLPAILPL